MVDPVNLVLIEDIKLNEVVSVAEQIIVGRLYGRRMGEKNLQEWTNVN
jgi:hypothetical protein